MPTALHLRKWEKFAELIHGEVVFSTKASFCNKTSYRINMRTRMTYRVVFVISPIFYSMFQIISHFKNLRESKPLKFDQSYREKHKDL